MSATYDGTHSPSRRVGLFVLGFYRKNRDENEEKAQQKESNERSMVSAH
jgi:hypothetical protein